MSMGRPAVPKPRRMGQRGPTCSTAIKPICHNIRCKASMLALFRTCAWLCHSQQCKLACNVACNRLDATASGCVVLAGHRCCLPHDEAYFARHAQKPHHMHRNESHSESQTICSMAHKHISASTDSHGPCLVSLPTLCAHLLILQHRPFGCLVVCQGETPHRLLHALRRLLYGHGLASTAPAPTPTPTQLLWSPSCWRWTCHAAMQWSDNVLQVFNTVVPLASQCRPRVQDG